MCAAQPLTDDAPLLRLRGTRLDYLAAANAMARGRPAAEVALAAGSRARSRRNLRVVGLRIEARLLRREVLQDLCAEVGLTLDTVLLKLKELLEAEKPLCVGRVGGRVLTVPVPDHRAQLQAVALLIRILGIHKLPVLCDPPTHIEVLFTRRPVEDWQRVADLSPAQFDRLMTLVCEDGPEGRQQHAPLPPVDQAGGGNQQQPCSCSCFGNGRSHMAQPFPVPGRATEPKRLAVPRDHS